MLLSYRILHGLHILFDIRYAVGSVGFTEFDNGRTHDDAVGLGDHFLGLLWVGDSEAYGTWDVFLGFDEFTMAPMSVVIWLRMPVTPREDTQ